MRCALDCRTVARAYTGASSWLIAPPPPVRLTVQLAQLQAEQAELTHTLIEAKVEIAERKGASAQLMLQQTPHATRTGPLLQPAKLHIHTTRSATCAH